MYKAYIAAAAVPALDFLLRLAGEPPQERWGPTVIKVSATALLAAGGISAGVPALIVIGLVLGAMGDVPISRGTRHFQLVGMAAFGVAHLAYAAAFWSGMPGPAMAVAAMMALLGSTAVWLAPRVPAGLKGPWVVYMAALTAMALAALSLPFGAVVIGMVLIVLSDLLEGWSWFAEREPLRQWPSVACWALYWPGQALILWGMIPAQPG